MDYQLGPGPLQVDQNTIDEKIKGDIGIVENGDVAIHAIPKGYYVIWKGDLYVSKTDISSGTTLGTSNLTAKPNGLGAEVAALNSKFDPYYNNAISDCNALMSTGRYKAINSTVNTPFSSHFVIDVVAYSQSEVSQIAKQIYSSRTFARGTADGGATWSAWEELALNSKIGNVQDCGTFNGNQTISSIQTNCVRNGFGFCYLADTIASGWAMIVCYAWATGKAIQIACGTAFIYTYSIDSGSTWTTKKVALS